MKKHLSRLSLVSLFITHSSMAMSGVYSYDIRYIDRELGSDACGVMMAEAGARFAEASDVQILSTGCETDRVLERQTGKIVYSAEARISPWSTTSTTYGEQLEFYVSKGQCEAALPAEVQLIESRSSLKPFVSFCQKISEIGPPRYRTRIDAIGQSQLRRYESAAITRYPLHDLNGTVQSLNDQARSLGLSPFAWYFGVARSQQGLSVAYYADASNAPYSLLAKNTLFFPTLSECQTAITTLRQTQTIAWNGTPACVVAPPTVGFQLSLIWWDRGIGADLILKSTTIPGNHANLSACRASAAELSERLARTGEKVVGIVCGWDNREDSPIKMELITYAR